MVKVLQIFSEQKEGKENKFPDGIKIYDFSYTGSRMSIPTLTATLKYHECLDSKWDYNQYVEFRGEKYWVSQIPSSSKDNTDHRYKHDIIFYSERNILTKVYFYDIVNTDNEKGTYHSNSASVLFFGTLEELVSRINSSLEYAGLYNPNASNEEEKGYYVTIGKGVETEVKEFSCENTFIFDALTQAFDTWDIPFYFKGKQCVFDYCSVDYNDDSNKKNALGYGIESGLLKIERSNANTRIITRATGVGSSENIPFYYPNDSEKGNFTFDLKSREGETILNYEFIDKNKLACSVENGITYTYSGEQTPVELNVKEAYAIPAGQDEVSTLYNLLDGAKVPVNSQLNKQDVYIYFSIDAENTNVTLKFKLETSNANILSLSDVGQIYVQQMTTVHYETADGKGAVRYEWVNVGYDNLNELVKENGTSLTTTFEKGLPSGGYRFALLSLNVSKYLGYGDYTYGLGDNGFISIFDNAQGLSVTTQNWWIPSNGGKKIKSLKSIGVDYNEYPPHIYTKLTEDDISGLGDIGAKFTLNLIDGEKMVYQDRLMPSIYSRGSAFDGAVKAANKGVERYYDAKNGLYSGIGDFVNELNRFNRSENIYTYEDIKPTIENVENIDGYFINEIVDVAFDENDNDSVLGEEYGSNADNYAHPYFYAKIRRTRIHNDVADKRNDFNFNLFNRANEKDSMTIQMTSGDLNGCKFKVQVVEDKGDIKNPIQVYTQSEAENGIIPDGYSIGEPKKGDKEDKVSQSSFVENQQDTKENEVWLVLMKDQDTFGIILPSLTNKQVVKAGDTFNIIGISMPEAYIIAAERKLDNHIVKDMHEENKEYFNYSIDFSRIFLKDDYDRNKGQSWVNLLNETIKLPITYGSLNFSQYVTSFSYECKENELLPKISVELANTIAKSETFEEKIVSKSSTRASKKASQSVWASVENAGFASQRNVETKATKANTLGGYGIKDAYVEKDGTIVLGGTSIRPLTASDKTTTLDWTQITNKPFEDIDDNTLKVKKGLFSDSFISAKGIDSTTGGNGGGGSGEGEGGLDVSQLWNELRASDSSKIIDESHIPSSIMRKSEASGFLTKEDLMWKNIRNTN